MMLMSTLLKLRILLFSLRFVVGVVFQASSALCNSSVNFGERKRGRYPHLLAQKTHPSDAKLHKSTAELGTDFPPSFTGDTNDHFAECSTKFKLVKRMQVDGQISIFSCHAMCSANEPFLAFR